MEEVAALGGFPAGRAAGAASQAGEAACRLRGAAPGERALLDRARRAAACAELAELAEEASSEPLAGAAGAAEVLAVEAAWRGHLAELPTLAELAGAA